MALGLGAGCQRVRNSRCHSIDIRLLHVGEMRKAQNPAAQFFGDVERTMRAVHERGLPVTSVAPPLPRVDANVS